MFLDVKVNVEEFARGIFFAFFYFSCLSFSFPYRIPHSFRPLFHIILAGKAMTRVVELEFLRKFTEVRLLCEYNNVSSFSDEASKNHSCQCCIFISLTGTEWGDD
jgi:hypothetical protein